MTLVVSNSLIAGRVKYLVLQHVVASSFTAVKSRSVKKNNKRGLTDKNSRVKPKKQAPPKKRRARVVDWIKIISSLGRIIFDLYNKIA